MPWRGGGGVRQLLRAGTDGALDMLYPLLVLARGAARLASLARERWSRMPGEKRGPALFLAAACGLVLWLMPYGPALAAVSLVTAAAWYGRDRTGPAVHEVPGPAEDEDERLQAVYEALVPCFAMADDPHPEPMYAHDGGWERAFEDYEFCAEGRLCALLLRYPAHFRDGEPEERLRVERLLAAKSGRAREYRFAWDEEHNRLGMRALEPLPTGIGAQPFVTAPGETVLGFTDGDAVRRTVPVEVAELGAADMPPVVWRTGARSTEPHLLAMGTPGSGTSTLLRSVALQALRRGEVLVVDGDGGGEFACLAGRHGVLAVESSLPGAMASFEWVVRETERRLTAACRARQAGEQPPEEARRPLWLLVDRPAVLSHLARSEGRRDPQELLQVPLRHGRAAGVSVVIAEQFEGAEDLGQAVRAYTRARVVLGAVSREQARAVLGEVPQTGPVPQAPPGRGLARLGDGPVLRLQVPATPDPFDEGAGEAERRAVLALLPERVGVSGPVPG
nr:hypothetical protein [Streptomyces boncukensis]